MDGEDVQSERQTRVQLPRDTNRYPYDKAECQRVDALNAALWKYKEQMSNRSFVKEDGKIDPTTQDMLQDAKLIAEFLATGTV